MSTITTINREHLFEAVQNALKSLHQTLSTFKAEAINKVPYAGSWTAGQVVDHLLKSYSVHDTINGAVDDTSRDPLQFDAGIKNLFLNFEVKLQSPDFILPDKKEFDKQEQLDELQLKTTLFLDDIRKLDLTKTCMDFDLPQTGFLTRAEWLYFVSYHTRRHVHQLEKIAAAIPYSQEEE